MTIVRRPQPPGDAGSRKNLQNRKGKIDSVEHAYTGIINVYALVPGNDPISLDKFMHGTMVVNTTAPSTIRYSKVSKSTLPTREPSPGVYGSTVSQGPVRYVWGYNSHEKRNGLFARDIKGAAYGDDITTRNRRKGLTIANVVADRALYESILDNQPDLIKEYNPDTAEGRKEIYKATGYVVNIHEPIGSPKVQSAILSQAVRLGVTPRQMDEWMHKRLEMDEFREKRDKVYEQLMTLVQADKSEQDLIKYLMSDQKISEKEARDILNNFYKKSPSAKKKLQEHGKPQLEIPEQPKQFKTAPPPIITKVVEKLPIALDDPRIKGQISVAQSHSEKFVPLPVEARSTADNLYYTKDDKGNVSYFVKVSERSKKKHHAKLNRHHIIAYRIRRKHSTPKIKSKKLNSKKANKDTRSSRAKKSILQKLQCMCKRKRK